jgi:hypothetical protein
VRLYVAIQAERANPVGNSGVNQTFGRRKRDGSVSAYQWDRQKRKKPTDVDL